MRKVLALAFAVTLLSAFLLAQEGAGGSVEATLTQLETQAVTAAQKNDPSFMETYYADDYVGVGGSGTPMTKQSTVEALKSGASKYEHLEVQDRKITQYGPDVAIARGKVMVKAMISGRPIDGTFMYSRTWVQRGGKWQVVAFQSTKIS